jgi:hypothetical protein
MEEKEKRYLKGFIGKVKEYIDKPNHYRNYEKLDTCPQSPRHWLCLQGIM